MNPPVFLDDIKQQEKVWTNLDILCRFEKIRLEGIRIDIDICMYLFHNHIPATNTRDEGKALPPWKQEAPVQKMKK